MIRTYNPENVYVTLTSMDSQNRTDLKVLANWSTLTIAFAEDRWEFSTSTTGQITRSKIVNKLATAEIVSPEGSDVNDILAKLIGKNDKIFFRIVEKDDGVAIAEWTLTDASVSSPGSAEKARVNGERTWVLTGELDKWEESAYTK